MTQVEIDAAAALVILSRSRCHASLWFSGEDTVSVSLVVETADGDPDSQMAAIVATAFAHAIKIHECGVLPVLFGDGVKWKLPWLSEPHVYLLTTLEARVRQLDWVKLKTPLFHR